MSSCLEGDATNLDEFHLKELADPVTSNMGESECRYFDFLVCVIVIGAICAFGLVGNVTSFLILVKHKAETVAVYLLRCIAVSDSILLLSTLIVYSFPTIFDFMDRIESIETACEYIKTLVWPICMMAHTMTIYLTVLVTFNRYCAICRPVQDFRAQNTKTVSRHVVFTLLFSVFYNFPRFFEHNKIGSRPLSEDTSGINWTNISQEIDINLGDSKTYQIIYSNVIYYPVMYIFPLTCLGYLNGKLIHSLKAIGRKKAVLTSQYLRARTENDVITLCVIVIVCVFILCQTPALINQIFWAVLSNEERQCGHFHFYYTKLSDVLVVLNSACNIVIYCLCGRRFRMIFLRTLCRCSQCVTPEPQNSEQSDVMLRQLELQVNNNDPSDDEELKVENGTIEQNISHAISHV